MCQIADILWKSIMSCSTLFMFEPIQSGQTRSSGGFRFCFISQMFGIHLKLWHPRKTEKDEEKISVFRIIRNHLILPKTIIKLIFANFISLFLTLLISGWRLLFVSTTWTLLLWFLLEYFILPATSSGKFHWKRLNI